MSDELLEKTLKKMILTDDLSIYLFDVFNDLVTKYTITSGALSIDKKDTMTNYLEEIKTKVQSPYLKGYMNVVSIPKLKEELSEGKEKVIFKYQALSGKWYEAEATLINVQDKELILLINKQIKEDVTTSKEANDSKYDTLIRRLADSIIKIENVFNLDEKKTNIKNVEDYVGSIINGLTTSYPDLRVSLNKTQANVSGRVDDVILIVDDDMLTRKMIKKVFDDEYKIVMATNGKEAIDYLEENSKKGITESSDNILGIFLDLTMPVLDGFAVLEYLSKNNYLYRIPVIIISGDYEKETKARVYNYGVADMLEKPFDFQVVKHRIGNFINLYKSSNSLNNLISDQSRNLKDLINPFVESYQYDYEANIKNVNELIRKLSKQVMIDYPEYDLTDEKIGKMADASMYYDIGFYSIPRSILSKKDGFSEKELEKIKKYPLFGSKMLDYVLSLKSDAMYKKYADNITKFYHENYNGTGYPSGLKEDEIPLEAQLAAICINYNNLERKYGKVAKEMIIKRKDVMFNPKLIDSFSKIID